MNHNSTRIKLNIIMSGKSEYKRITANFVLDLYQEAKKTKGVKKEEIMKKVIYYSQHLNETIRTLK